MANGAILAVIVRSVNFPSRLAYSSKIRQWSFVRIGAEMQWSNDPRNDPFNDPTRCDAMIQWSNVFSRNRNKLLLISNKVIGSLDHCITSAWIIGWIIALIIGSLDHCLKSGRAEALTRVLHPKCIGWRCFIMRAGPACVEGGEGLDHFARDGLLSSLQATRPRTHNKPSLSYTLRSGNPC